MGKQSREILVAGETVVDFLPETNGQLHDVMTFTRRPGGAPANVAVGLSRLDNSPWFWTRVGADSFGDSLRQTLREEGVPDRFVERDPEAKTTLAFIERGTDPAFSFYRDGTADTRLEPGGIPTRILDNTEWVVVGGVTLASEPARTATIDLAERAQDAGCTVVFDPNARPELWTERSFPDTIEAFLPLVDVLKATPGDLHEAGFEGDVPMLADNILESGPHTILITVGRDGAVARSTQAAPWGHVSTKHGGYDVSAVDPTGAGDAFLAGIIAALTDGLRFDDALAFANAVAAMAITSGGAMSALPDRATVAALQSE